MKGTTKQIISVILTVLMLSASLCCVRAAETAPVNFTLEVLSKTVQAGQAFRVNVKMDFDDSFPADTGGITVMKWDLKFDPSKLDILDPYTMGTLSFDSNGAPADGSLFRYGEIGNSGSFETNMNEAGDTIVMLYGSTKAEGDIYTSGDLVQLAFRAKTDLEINNMATTTIELADAGVSVNNSDVRTDASGDTLDIGITPFFTVPGISAHKQNTTLTLEGRSTVRNSGYTLSAEISKDGTPIESKSVTLDSVFYSLDFELDEARYPTGIYNLTFTSGNSIATRVLEVVAKDAESTEPTDPSDPGDPDDPPKPDNPSKPGEDNKPGNTGGNSGSGGGGSSSGDKKPADTNAGTPAPSIETTPGVGAQYPSDIAGHWAAEYIKYVYDHKLMNGYEDGSFLPEGNITRAEFSAVMARFLDIKGDDNAAANFADVDGHWAKPYIGALTAEKIVGGVSDTEFEPDAEITREQIAVILSRAFGLTADIQSGMFTDETAISDWARSGVYAVVAAGYMQGNDNGSFSPLSEATRAEVATVISRIHSQKK